MKASGDHLMRPWYELLARLAWAPADASFWHHCRPRRQDRYLRRWCYTLSIVPTCTTSCSRLNCYSAESLGISVRDNADANPFNCDAYDSHSRKDLAWIGWRTCGALSVATGAALRVRSAQPGS
jgi:hypothetical protein